MKCWNSAFNAQGSKVIIESWLNLGMKCWNSAFNAQGSKVIIVAVHVGAVKIYVAANGKRKEGGWRQDEPSLSQKLMGFWVSEVGS
jgi:hypothetical protein